MAARKAKQAANTAKVPFSELTGVTNQQLFEIVAANNPGKFESVTSNGTAKFFTEQGFEAVAASDLQILNDFLSLSMKVIFQKFDIPRVRNIMEDSGLVETYATPMGGITQRIATENIMPIDPRFSPENIAAGNDNPFATRVQKDTERFFRQNFRYQSVISIQEFPLKTIFTGSENGIAAYVAAKMTGLENGFTMQRNANYLHVLMGGINSTTHPLRDSQKITLPWSEVTGDATDEQLGSFIDASMDVMSAIEDSVATGDFNAAGYESAWDRSDFVMFVRNPIKNRIRRKLRVGAYNPEDLAIPIDNVVSLNDFGDILPYKESTFETRLYPVYDAKWGSVVKDKYTETVGGAIEGAGTEITDDGTNVFWKDTHEDVLAIIAQKGLIFRDEQNPYQVIPIFNPANLITNYWASSPNNGINYDYYYNVIVITKATQA